MFFVFVVIISILQSRQCNGKFCRLHDCDFSCGPYSRKKAGAATQKSHQKLHQINQTSNALSRKRISGAVNGGLINDATVKSLDVRTDFLLPLSLLLHNTRPVGREVLG